MKVKLQKEEWLVVVKALDALLADYIYGMETHNPSTKAHEAYRKKTIDTSCIKGMIIHQLHEKGLDVE